MTDEQMKLAVSLMRMCAEQAQENEELIPRIHLVSDVVEVIFMPWTNDNQKEAMLEMAVLRAKKMNCEMVVFVCEAWRSRPSLRDYNAGTYVMASKDPLKQEILMTWVGTRAGTAFNVLDILRGPKKRVDLDSMEEFQEPAGGRIPEIFSKIWKAD